MNNKLFEFINSCPTAYHTVSTTAEMLKKKGFIEVTQDTELKPRTNYFITRNCSSLIAFKLPERLDSFMLSAVHGDTPSFKIKENAVIISEKFKRLSTEKYGGPQLATWMDRPLSIAGRVILETENGIEAQLIDLKAPMAIIPTVAPHIDHKCDYSMHVDMVPLYSGDELYKVIADTLNVKKESIISTDLFLYNPQNSVETADYIFAPRLDDLQCAFSALQGFISAENNSAATVFCLFDNEEVGSTTKQGADSTFLIDVLSLIAEAFNKRLDTLLSSSIMLSADNGHAVHPNHPELSDKNHSVYMNGGIIIKYHANQKYTTDGVSSGILKHILKRNNIPYQLYFNRADMRGGSTLGNISSTHVSLNTVDIGLAQLAMHSAFETAGSKDTLNMINAVTAFYSSTVLMVKDGKYIIK